MRNQSSGRPAESFGMLRVISPDGPAGRAVPVDPQGSVVGRNSGCDLTLASDHVSRRHAVVRVRAGGYEVEDLRSMNGTVLNGKRVTGTCRLRDGDRLGVADVEIEFRLPGAAAPRLRPLARWRRVLAGRSRRRTGEPVRLA
jgi:predicted component of type VI protein secretion system